MMNKAKHLTMLIFKFVFLIACFALASITTVLQSYSTPLLTATKNPVGLEGCKVSVMDSSFAQTGANLTYQIADGAIIFDLSQSGERYDDVTILISLPAYAYDSSALREYLNAELGKAAAKEEKYLLAMDEGPWKTKHSFTLTGETEGLNGNYTVNGIDGIDYTPAVQTISEETKTVIENLCVEKGDKLMFALTFGAENCGALPSGRYTFTSTVEVTGLYGERVPTISFGATMKILGKTCLKALKANGLRIFSVENWLSFYGVMVAFGMFIYLWRDLRCMVKIFGAVMSAGGEPIKVIVSTYVNGMCVESHTESRGGPSVLLALIVTILCFILFILTIPLRMLIFIVRDIVYLCKEDYDLEGFSYIGNILGSVGVYGIVFGLVCLVSQNLIVGGIATVVSIVMCVVASKLCKKKEEDYA